MKRMKFWFFGLILISVCCIPSFAQDLKRCDYFGFQAPTTCDFVKGKQNEFRVRIPRNRQLILSTVSYNSCDISMELELYSGFIPAPFDAGMMKATNDSIVTYFLKAMSKDNDSRKKKISHSEPETFALGNLKDPVKIMLTYERFENEGVIGKEGFQVAKQSCLFIGYAEDRVFVFYTTYGAKPATDKSFKDRHKSFTNFFKNFQANESPLKALDKSETEGFYFAWHDTVQMGNISDLTLSDGMCFRKGINFYNVDIPSFGKEVSDLSYYQPVLKLDEKRRIKSEYEKMIGVNALYRMGLYKYDELGSDRGLFQLIVEEKPGVYYHINCINDKERKRVLDGEFGLKFERVLNVFTRNRADMPSAESAVARGKEFAEKYYAALEIDAKKRFETADAIRRKSAGKMRLQDGLKGDSKILTEITMKENFPIYVVFFPKDGMQPAFDDTKFSVRVSGNGKTGLFPHVHDNQIGSLVNRGYGGNFFTGDAFIGHAGNELPKGMYPDRHMDESRAAMGNKFIINTVNALGLKAGFKGLIKVELLNTEGTVISEGSYTLTVPADEYKGDNDMCFLSKVSRHDATIEEAIKKAFKQSHPEALNVVRVLLNDEDWRIVKDYSIIRGRKMSARVIYLTQMGTYECIVSDFFAAYDVRTATFTEHLKFDKDYGLKRPIGCDCDL